MRQLDQKFVVDTLHEQAERLHKLADRLSDKGEPLTQAEKRDVRLGLMPYVREVHGEAEFFFMLGNFESYDQSRKQIFSLMEELAS